MVKLVDLVNCYGTDKGWSYYFLSKNINVTLDDIISNPHVPWCSDGISSNPNIIPSNIYNYPQLPSNLYWDPNGFNTNPNLKFNDILPYLNGNYKLKIGFWYFLTCNKGIKVNNVLDTDYPWYYPSLSSNPNTTLYDIKNNPHIAWNYNNLSDHPNVPFEEILANPQLDWSWSRISSDRRTTFQRVKQNPDKQWSPYWLSSNKSITLDDVLTNPDFPWSIHGLSCNKSITFEQIIKHPNPLKGKHSWDWKCLVANNPYISFDLLYNKSLLPKTATGWTFDLYSCNNGLKLQEVIEHPHINWNFEELSSNKFGTSKNKSLLYKNNSSCNVSDEYGFLFDYFDDKCHPANNNLESNNMKDSQKLSDEWIII